MKKGTSLLLLLLAVLFAKCQNHLIIWQGINGINKSDIKVTVDSLSLDYLMNSYPKKIDDKSTVYTIYYGKEKDVSFPVLDSMFTMPDVRHVYEPKDTLCASKLRRQTMSDGVWLSFNFSKDEPSLILYKKIDNGLLNGFYFYNDIIYSKTYEGYYSNGFIQQLKIKSGNSINVVNFSQKCARIREQYLIKNGKVVQYGSPILGSIMIFNEDGTITFMNVDENYVLGKGISHYKIYDLKEIAE